MNATTPRRFVRAAQPAAQLLPPALLPLALLLLASCAEPPRQALTAVEAQDIAECRLVEALAADPDTYRRCLLAKGY